MSLQEKFIQFIRTESLFNQGDLLILAVSGGVDSVVLCELCHDAGYSFIIAHCNFQLRGEESGRDEMFVRGLANKYDTSLLVKHFDTEKYALLHRVSIQVAARELRYGWFAELLGEKKSIFSDGNSEWLKGELEPGQSKGSNPALAGLPRPNYVLTAHHLDDNIETVLMNFFKGTGVAGMRGMLPKNGKLVRPLLQARKEELLNFAKGRNLLFVEDSSNSSDKYSRNYFRRQVIPLIQKIYPEAEKNLADNIDKARDLEILYHQAIELHKKKLLEHRGDELYIPILKLRKSSPIRTIIYEIIREYGFSPKQVDGVLKLMESESGKYMLSPTHRILRNRNWFIISKLENQSGGMILIEENQRRAEFENGILEFEWIPNIEFKMPLGEKKAFLDADRIEFPLLLRKWQKGDYFYPLGMPKKKKLARFFIDQKMSLQEKEKTWVLEMNKKIVWVVGKRIDDRFKIGNATKNVLRISWLDVSA
jgi:tRNA(Ile)-lysidine synthase